MFFFFVVLNVVCLAPLYYPLLESAGLTGHFFLVSKEFIYNKHPRKTSTLLNDPSSSKIHFNDTIS